MSPIPCSLCRRRVPGKLASAYWAWFNADGERTAWKVRYCLDCAQEALSKVLANSLSQDPSTDVFCCVSCGADVTNDSDPMYLTLYLPGRESAEYEFQLDGACAARLRIPITQSGSKLPDRGPSAGSDSRARLTAAWDALGLNP